MLKKAKEENKTEKRERECKREREKHQAQAKKNEQKMSTKQKYTYGNVGKCVCNSENRHIDNKSTYIVLSAVQCRAEQSSAMSMA